MLIGPHTSVCMISNKSLARSIVPENGVLVILPMRHGSHVSNDSKSRDSKSPSAWSFFIRLTPNMTKAAVPHVSGTIVINVNSFGTHTMDMCNITFEIHQE